MPGRILLALAAVAAAGAGGCGTSDDRDAVREVTTGFYAAIAADDGDGACALLTTQAVQQLESQTGQACDDVVTRLDLDGGEVEHAEVYATSGRAQLTGGESAFLTRERDGWRLSAIGCAPEQGKPRDRPFDCELEA